MKLVSVTLRNFRCYQEATTIAIDSLTTIIGRNDVGKSSVLEALEIFFNNATVKIDNEDCHVSSGNRTIEITCEFVDLPTTIVLDNRAQTSLADEYLLAANGNLRIRKTFRCTASKPKEEVSVLAHHPTVDQYDNLLQLNNNALKNRLRNLGIDENGVHLNSNPSIRRAIWRSCADLRLGEVAIPVAGEDGKRIWEKLREQLPLFALFQSDRASRDSDAEVQDPMKFAVETALADPDIKQKRDEIVVAVREKALELAERTHLTLQEIDPELAHTLTPEFKAEPKWQGIFSLTLNSDQGIPVNKRGSGVRRLILVSFFRAEAERKLSQGGIPSVIYAIEEPETSQHPHNQRILLESLKDLASEPGCQVILTTHSPGFASYLPISSFRFIQKDENDKPLVEAATDATWEAIASALGVVPDNRVRVLVCVEGPTDVEAIGYLSRALHAEDYMIPDISTDLRVSFVALGGSNLSHWVNKHYLRGLG
ncbi:MAG: ATP-binding protein, partial [Methanothrix sp.]|nr:ATP-binding protein [Methanothrix sp.]